MPTEPSTLREVGIILSSIQEEVADVKSISMETRTHARDTNGKVAEVKEEQARQQGFNDAIKWVMGFVIVASLSSIGYLFVNIQRISGIIDAQAALLKILQGNQKTQLEDTVRAVNEAFKNNLIVK